VLSPATATNTPIVASTTPAEVARKATRLTLTEYTARTKQPSAAPHISTDKPAHSDPLDEVQTVYWGGAQECPDDSLDPFDVEVEVNAMPKPINVNMLSSTQVSHNSWFMNSIEEHPRPKPSLWIRRKDNKLGSANKLANWTSTSGSTVLLDDVFRPATATINPIVTSDSTLANNTLVHVPIKTSDYTLENYMPLPTPNETSTRTLENNILVPTPSKTSTHTLKDNMMVPTLRKTSTHALELEDDAVVPATSITPPAVIFNSTFRLLDLPRELRDDIYAYLTPDETFWIGRPPVVGEEKNAIVERYSMHKSAALIKSKHSLIFACRATRDEFRSALWRAYVEDADRQAALRVYDFDPKPIIDLFNGCTALELPKLLSKGGRLRVHMYLSGDLRRYRGLVQLDPRGLIQTLIMRWVSFCDEHGFVPNYSFSRCTWDDMAVVDLAICQGNVDAGPEDWDEFQTVPHFVRLVPYFRRQFGRLFIGGGSLDHQDQLIWSMWRF
jgi:hypothetical protein